MEKQRMRWGHRVPRTVIEFPALFIVCLFFAGCGGSGSAVQTLVQPSTPSDVNVSLLNGKVTISWGSSSNATSYNVYAAQQSGVNKTNYATLTEGSKYGNVVSPYVFLGLTQGKRYYLVVTATNASAESAESSEVSFLTDDFSTNTGMLIQDGICCAVNGNGTYTMNYQKEEGKLYWSLADEKFSNFTYSVKAAKIAGSDKWGYGMIFRVQDLDNGYEFAVSGIGDYYVGKVEKGVFKNLLSWTVNSSLNKGNATNYLQIVTKGNIMSFYCNGTLLTTITDTSFSSGKLGFISYAQVDVEFDDFFVSNGNSSKSDTITPTIIVQDDFSVANLFPDNSKVCNSKYENGEYIFRYTDKGSCYTWITQTFSDFTFTVKARKISGKDLQGYGVVFRLDEQTASYYDFIVSGNGDYSIGKFINGEFFELAPWTIDNSINKGNATNNLKIEAKGNSLNYYVNDILVKTITDDTFKTGKIGLKAFNDEEIAFDDFRVEGS